MEMQREAGRVRVAEGYAGWWDGRFGAAALELPGRLQPSPCLSPAGHSCRPACSGLARRGHGHISQSPLVFGMLAATAVGGTPARLCSPPSCGWCTWHWAALPLRSSPGPWSCSGHPRRGGPASSREPWNSGEQALRAPRLSQDGCGCFKERGAGLGLVLACVLRVRGGPGGPVPWRRFYWPGHNVIGPLGIFPLRLQSRTFQLSVLWAPSPLVSDFRYHVPPARGGGDLEVLSFAPNHPQKSA